MYLWHASNLVEGPASFLRTDDPGDAVDSFSRLPGFSHLSNNDRKKVQIFVEFAEMANGFAHLEDVAHGRVNLPKQRWNSFDSLLDKINGLRQWASSEKYKI